MQQRVQTDATANIQQCWELLAIINASACWGLTLTISEIITYIQPDRETLLLMLFFSFWWRWSS